MAFPAGRLAVSLPCRHIIQLLFVADQFANQDEAAVPWLSFAQCKIVKAV